MTKESELIRVLSSNFGLTGIDSSVDTDSEFYKYIQTKLAYRIEHLINTNIDYLMHALYTIDVKQEQTDSAFDLGEIKQVSMKLAELIINRQLQKIEYAKSFYNK